MNRTAILVVGAFLCAFTPSVPDGDPEGIRVLSVERKDEERLVTLRGTLEGPDGTRLRVRLLPVVRHLGGDGRQLILSTTLIDAITVQSELRNGSYTVRFRTRRPDPHEILVTETGAGTSVARYQGIVPLFETESLGDRNRRALQELEKHTSTIRGFLAELKPYGREGRLVPMKLARRLVEMETPVRYWAQTTWFTATGAVLKSVLSGIGAEVPWEDDAPEEGGDSLYGRAPKPEERPFSLEPLEQRLDSAREVFLRETILAVLVPMEELVGRIVREESGSRSAAARKTLGELCRFWKSVSSGALRDVSASYDPSSAVGVVLTEAEALTSALPPEGVTLEEEARTGVRGLEERIRSLLEGVMRPESPP